MNSKPKDIDLDDETNIRYFHPQEPRHGGGGKFSAGQSKYKIEPRPIPEKQLKKWQFGERVKGHTKTRFHDQRSAKRDEVIHKAAEKLARGQFLCTEDSGHLQGEETHRITQFDLKAEADEATQHKIFDLKLDQFGPYRVDYTRNGRHLLIGGAKGHVAAFDWQTKRLHCEINVMETVSDIKWLHQETMFAVAQKKWVYMYDNQGIELHCLKHLDSVQRMEFLPYHFLLCTANAKGYLAYLDVSLGKEIFGTTTKMGRLDIMALNPQSAVVHLGHANGTVTLWTPNMKEAAAKVLCHASGLRDIAVDITGNYMATTAMDRRLKIFDLRTYKELSRFQYNKRLCPSLLDFSQKGLLAVSRDNVVEVYQDMTKLSEKPEKPYLYHRCDRMLADLAFCPYEDVLGLGHTKGFSSIVVPGAGEPNYDASEANPFISKSQRKHAEVRMLLDKVKPEMITLEGEIGQVDLLTAKELQEERHKKRFLKPDKIDFSPRFKKKGRSSGAKVIQRKKGVQEAAVRSKVRDIIRTKQQEAKEKAVNKKRKEGSALDRMKRKIV